MSRFLSELNRYKRMIDDYIFAHLPRSHPIPEIDNLFEMMRDYPSRSGKGLRPSILLMFCRAFGGAEEIALNTAAALELFQNWIVIHDDIEDDSELRRGQPALHVKHGIPLAINAGDALAGKMWQFLNFNRNIIGPEKTLDVIEQFLIMYDETTAGQHVELSWVRNKRWDLTRQHYFDMCRRKTAWYTCVTPAWTGALIAGAPAKFKEIIHDFGMNMGVAFQIQDDILNLAGEQSLYGKEIGGDLWEGKRTLITIDLMEKATAEEKAFLREVLDRPRREKTQADLDKIMELIRRYRCLDSARETALEFFAGARRSFALLDGNIDEEQKELISEMIDFVIDRKS